MVEKEAVLAELGLTDKETAIYLTLLGLGQSTVTNIAKKTSLNRVTCYDILNHLEKKGIVAHVIRAGVKYFEAADPQTLLGELQEKEQKLSAILPELESLKKTLTQKPSVEVYDGIPGIKTIIEDYLNEAQESWWIVAPIFIDSLEFYFPHFVKKKRKLGLPSKAITPECKQMRDYQKKAPKRHIDFRFVKETLPTTKIIYADKVAILTFEKENSIGVLIQNKQIADTERKLFNMLWKGAKE